MRSSASAASGRSASTSASSRRRIATCRRWSRRRRSARTSITGSPVFPIVIPPLRDRPNDIRAFAEYFAERAANRFGLKPVPVSEDDVRAARRVSMAGKRAGDCRGDGSRGAHRPGALARGRRRTRPSTRPSTAANHSAASRAIAGPSSRSTSSCDATSRRRSARPTAASRVRTAPRGCSAINPHTLRARMRKLKVDWRAFRAPNLG